MIAPEAVSQVVDLLERGGSGAGAKEEVARRLPDVRFTWCSDDDVYPAAKPVAAGSGFRIYLVGGGSGCLSLTNDFDNAAGIVLAEVDAETED